MRAKCSRADRTSPPDEEVAAVVVVRLPPLLLDAAFAPRCVFLSASCTSVESHRLSGRIAGWVEGPSPAPATSYAWKPCTASRAPKVLLVVVAVSRTSTSVPTTARRTTSVPPRALSQRDKTTSGNRNSMDRGGEGGSGAAPYNAQKSSNPKVPLCPRFTVRMSSSVSSSVAGHLSASKASCSSWQSSDPERSTSMRLKTARS